MHFELVSLNDIVRVVSHGDPVASWGSAAPAATSTRDLDGPQARTASRFVPGLDLGELARLVDLPEQHAALRGFRDRLRGS